LDDDLDRLLREEMRRSGKSFKEVVNHFLRQGLTVSRQPFVVTPRALGLPMFSHDNVGELLETLERPSHK